MFELGLSLTAQQGLMSPPSDVYLGGSLEQKNDRLWLQLINDSYVLNDIGRNLSSKKLCDQLVCKVNSLATLRCSGGNQYVKGFESLAIFRDSLVEDCRSSFPVRLRVNKGRAPGACCANA